MALRRPPCSPVVLGVGVVLDRLPAPSHQPTSWRGASRECLGSGLHRSLRRFMTYVCRLECRCTDALPSGQNRMPSTVVFWALLCLTLSLTLSVDAAAYRCREIGKSTDEEYKTVRSIHKRGNLGHISGYYRCPQAEELIRRALDERTDETVRADRPSYSTVFSEIAAAVKKKTGKPAYIYLVGGPVRDALQGKAPKDIDASIDVSLQTVSLALEKYTKYIPDKTKNQNFLLLIGAEDQGVDLTHTDNNVNAGNEWRDVSVNALYYDIETGVVLDGTGFGVEDISTNTLRISKEDDSWCKAKSVHCGAKIQRYIHMRVKGFIPRLETAQVVLPLLQEVVDENGKDLRELQFKLAKSTFSPILSEEKRYNRFVLALMAITSDIVTFASLHGILKRRDDPRTEAERWFWTKIAPLLFHVSCYPNRKCTVKPEYGVVIPQLECILKSHRETHAISFDDREESVSLVGGPMTITSCNFNKKPVVRDERPPVEEGCAVVLETRIELVNYLTDATTKNLRKLCPVCDISKLQDEFKDYQKDIEGSAGRVVKEYDGVKWAARELARRATEVLVAYKEVAPQLLKYERLYSDIEASYLPGATQVVTASTTALFMKEYEVNMATIDEILEKDDVDQHMALAYHLLTGLPALRIPIPKTESNGQLSASDVTMILAKIHREIPGCVQMGARLDLCEANEDMAAKYGSPDGWAFLAKYCDGNMCEKQRKVEDGRPVVVNGNFMVSKQYVPGFLLQCQGNGFPAKGGPAIEAAELYALSTEILGFSDQDLELVALALTGWLTSNNGPYTTYEVLSSTLGHDLSRLGPVHWLMQIASVLTTDHVVKGETSKTVHTPEGFIRYLVDGSVDPAKMFVDLSLKPLIQKELSQLLSRSVIFTMPDVIRDREDPLGSYTVADTYDKIAQEARNILKKKEEDCKHKQDLWNFAEEIRALAEGLSRGITGRKTRNNPDIRESIRQLLSFVEYPDIAMAKNIWRVVTESLNRIEIDEGKHDTLIKKIAEYRQMALKHRYFSPCKASRSHFQEFQSLENLLRTTIRAKGLLTKSLEMAERGVEEKVEECLLQIYKLPRCIFPFEERTSDIVFDTPECAQAQGIRRAAISLFVQKHVIPYYPRGSTKYSYGHMVSVKNSKRMVVGVTLKHRFVRHLFNDKIDVVSVEALTMAERSERSIEPVEDRGPVYIAGGPLYKDRVAFVQQCSKPVGFLDDREWRMRYKVPMKVDGFFRNIDVLSGVSLSLLKPVAIPTALAAAVGEALGKISIGELVHCQFKEGNGDSVWLPGIVSEVMVSDPVLYRCTLDWDELNQYQALPFSMVDISPTSEVIVDLLSSPRRIYSRSKNIFQNDIRTRLLDQYRVREGAVVSWGSQGYGTVTSFRVENVGEDLVTPSLILTVRKSDGKKVRMSASSLKEMYEYPSAVGPKLYSWIENGRAHKTLEVNVNYDECRSLISRANEGSDAVRSRRFGFSEDWYPVTAVEARGTVSENNANVAFVIGGVRGGSVEGLPLQKSEVAPRRSDVVTMPLPVLFISKGAPPACIRRAPSYYTEGVMELAKIVYQINMRFYRNEFLVDIDGTGTWTTAKMSDVATISGGGVVVPISYDESYMTFFTSTKNVDWRYVKGRIKSK